MFLQGLPDPSSAAVAVRQLIQAQAKLGSDYVPVLGSAGVRMLGPKPQWTKHAEDKCDICSSSRFCKKHLPAGTDVLTPQRVRPLLMLQSGCAIVSNASLQREQGLVVSAVVWCVCAGMPWLQRRCTTGRAIVHTASHGRRVRA